MPLVSWATLTAIAERLAPVFDAAGLGELEERQRVDCAEGWVIAVLEQLDAPALLQAHLGELIGEERRIRALSASGRS